MGNYYLEGVSTLLVFERESDDVSHIKDEQRYLREENKSLQERIKKLESKLGDTTFDMMKQLLKEKKK